MAETQITVPLPENHRNEEASLPDTGDAHAEVVEVFRAEAGWYRHLVEYKRSKKLVSDRIPDIMPVSFAAGYSHSLR